MEVAGPAVKLYASSFGQQLARHGRIVEQALNDARRLVEEGKDVGILLDSLTRLARAHNLSSDMWEGPRSGRGGYGSPTLSGGIGGRALEGGRRVLWAARAPGEGGSLAICGPWPLGKGRCLCEGCVEEW